MSSGGFVVTDANYAAATGDIGLLQCLTPAQLHAVQDRRGWRPLHHAVHKDQLKATQLLVNAGLLDTIDNDKMTPLHRAVGHVDCLKAILEVKPPASILDARDKRGCSALILAAASGCARSTSLLVDGGSSLAVSDKRKRTALAHAAMGGHGDALRVLLEVEACNVNIQDSTLQTPLIFSAQHGHTEVAKLLINAGAEVNCRAKSGATPLWEAAAAGHTKVIEVLLQAGASVTSAITKAPTSSTALYQGCLAGHVEVVHALISRMESTGARSSFTKLLMRQCGPEKSTAMHAAAIGGHIEIIPLLLAVEARIEAMPARLGSRAASTLSVLSVRGGSSASIATGPLIDACDGRGRSPLHVACSEGKSTMVKVLAQAANDAPPGYERPMAGLACDGDGCTPLHLAAANGHADALRAVLAYLGGMAIPTAALGMGAGILDYSGEGALTKACRGGHVECVNELLSVCSSSPDAEELVNQLGSGPEGSRPFLEAVRLNRLGVVKAMMGCKKLNKMATDARGWSALHVACFHGGLEVVDLLLDGGAMMEARSGGSVGATPLMRCCCHDHDHVLSRLMARGAKARSVDNQGATALHHAAAFGKVPNKCVETLLSGVGVGVDATDSRGRSALMVAMRECHFDFVSMLIDKYGADPLVPDANGCTPLHVACMMGSAEAGQVLLSRESDRQRLLVARTNDGKTPLFCAVVAGVLELIEVLLNVGASPDTQTTREAGGQSCLHAAVEGRLSGKSKDVDWLAVITLLLRRGSSAQLLNAKGKTPYNCVTEARDAAAAHIFEGGYTL